MSIKEAVTLFLKGYPVRATGRDMEATLRRIGERSFGFFNDKRYSSFPVYVARSARESIILALKNDRVLSVKGEKIYKTDSLSSEELSKIVLALFKERGIIFETNEDCIKECRKILESQDD